MKRDNLLLLYQTLSTKGDWCSANELAMKLNTSTRTVRNYVTEINRKSKQGPLIISSDKGYLWNREIVRKVESSSHFRKKIPATPEGRYWYIIRKIIVEEIHIDDLMDNLFISISTIDADLRYVRNIASRYNLKLRRRDGRLYFSGRNTDLRLLSYQCIINNIFDITNHKYLSDDFILSGFPEYDDRQIDHILRALEDTLHRYHLTANAYDHNELFILVLLQYREIAHGRMIPSPECPVAGIQNYYEFTAANNLADRLAALTGCEYNRWEREYLAVLLISKTETNFFDKCALVPNYVELKNTTISYLTYAGEALSCNLLKPDFIDYIACYLQRLMVRSLAQLTSKDPTFHSLKVSHPVVQNVSVWFLITFAKHYRISIDRNEVGFLTKLLCEFLKGQDYPFDMTVNCTLVCPSFGNFPRELLNTLETRLADAIHIHTVIDTLNVDQIEDSSELYLSVLPLQNIRHLVNISLYPRSADFRHIYAELHRIKMKTCCEQLACYFSELVTKDTFEIGASFSSMEHALSHICRRLLKSGHISEGLQEQITEREDMDVSVFNHTAAVPYIRSRNVNADFVFIIASSDPVRWKDDHVNIICMIGAKNENVRQSNYIYDLATRVFSYHPNVNAILRAYDLNSFLDMLKTIDLA